jgi:hypothetical protein
METQPQYLFDVVQFKEYGGEIFENSYFYRFIESKKLFFKSRYLPYGPVCKTKEDFDKFISDISNFKTTKIKIDLPLILDQKIREYIVSKLKDLKFKPSNYLQDDETFFVLPETFHLKSKYMRYVRKALEDYEIEVKDNITSEELNSIYAIYLVSAQRIGFKPKSIEVFKKLSENAVFSLALHKETKQVEGYVLGYKSNFYSNGFLNSNTTSKVLQIIFTGTTLEGRNSQLGYPMHYEMFKKAFEEYKFDYIDFHGASRSQGKSYTEFKESFGGEYVKLPGSFGRLFLI